MTDGEPPDIDVLRSYVRGELTDDEESRISRWLVRCPDPDLPSVLFNLRFEWEQEKADERLPPDDRQLSALFLRLWEARQADFDNFVSKARQQPELEYASAHEISGREGFVLTRLDDGRDIVDRRDFRVEAYANPNRRRAVGVWTCDDENIDPNRFFDESLDSDHRGPVTRREPFEFERSDRRVTFWFAAADEPSRIGAVPKTPDLLYEWLTRLDKTNGCTVRALRLTTRVLTDLYE